MAGSRRSMESLSAIAFLPAWQECGALANLADRLGQRVQPAMLDLGDDGTSRPDEFISRRSAERLPNMPVLDLITLSDSTLRFVIGPRLQNAWVHGRYIRRCTEFVSVNRRFRPLPTRYPCQKGA